MLLPQEQFVGYGWSNQRSIDDSEERMFLVSQLSVSGSCYFNVFPTCDHVHSLIFLPFTHTHTKCPITPLEQFVDP